ncbi:MAG: CvpA family protein, partial [Planctomycetes bacterium]|nr:CvpA family protein [Planctomycetota bacterium]
FIFGYFKGFVIQALGIIGIGLAFYLAARFHRPLAEMPVLSGVREQSPSAALVVSFVAVFFVVAALTSTITFVIGRKVKHTAVRPADKWFGGLLGLTKGVLLLGGAAVGLQEYGFPLGAVVPGRLQEVPGDQGNAVEAAIGRSALIPYLAEGCLIAVRLVPKETREELVKVYREQTRGILGSEEGGAGESPAGGTAAKSLIPQNLAAKPAGSLPEVSTPPGGADGASSKIAAKEKPGLPADAPRDQLLDLGQWRQIVVEEKETIARPVPATAPADEKAEPVPSTAKETP